jgi:hypothetical protein
VNGQASPMPYQYQSNVIVESNWSVGGNDVDGILFDRPVRERLAQGLAASYAGTCGSFLVQIRQNPRTVERVFFVFNWCINFVFNFWLILSSQIMHIFVRTTYLNFQFDDHVQCILVTFALINKKRVSFN